MENLTDEQLIHNYLSGDEEALRPLFSRYLGPIYNFVVRCAGVEEAEDITQNIFINAWKNFKKFDESKKFKTWIFAIAKNASINWLKKKKPKVFSEFENQEGENFLEESIHDPAPLPEELFDMADLNGQVDSAVEKLAPNYRAVLSLHYNNGLTFREIAESLEEPVDTIKSRHRRAIIMLKKILLF